MPLVFETDAEREALTAAWGDCAAVGSFTVRGQYEEPQAEDLLVEGTAPTFLASLAELEAASVAIGTIFDSVTTFDGRSRGPFRVVRWPDSGNVHPSRPRPISTQPPPSSSISQ